MTENTNETNDTRQNKAIKCICGSEAIEHSHGDLWKCEGCGRFHNPKQLDRLAKRSPATRGGSVCQ